MKILYLITGLTLGGAEKVVIELAEKMHILGNDVKIVYLKGEAILQPKFDKIELIPLNLNKPFSVPKASKKYQSIIKEFKPDVVHAHMVHANIFARIQKAFLPQHYLICTAHNANEGGGLRMLAYRLTNHYANVNTNVSEEATQAFKDKKAFKDSAITVYNGINLNKFHKKCDVLEGKKELGLELNAKVLLAVGRLHEQKDYPNLINAFNMLKNKEKHFDYKLLIVGDGDQKNNIQHLINELGLQNNIILLGRRNDVARLMSMADLFVLSSAYEGFGLVVAEAMAAKTYVVATDAGGVKEVMSGFGKLVPPKKSDLLAQAMSEALSLSDSEKIQNNDLAYEHVIKNFDLDKIVEKWLKLYAKK